MISAVPQPAGCDEGPVDMWEALGAVCGCTSPAKSGEHPSPQEGAGLRFAQSGTDTLPPKSSWKS